MARALGDDPLLVSLRRLEAGGRENAELKAVGALGKYKGVGATARALIDKESHMSDATVDVLPIKMFKVYAVSDSTLKLRKGKNERRNSRPDPMSEIRRQS